MKIDAVFSGGGVKAFAYIGVLESIEKHQFKIERVAGTSAGAIIASFIAARFSLKEIETFIKQLDVSLFMDPPLLTKYLPFTKWIFLYYQMGVYKGDQLEEWLENILAEKNIYTFKDVKEGDLKIIASDLSLGKLVVFPDDLESYYGIDPKAFPIAKAVRMSAGFPFFFIPAKLRNKTNSKSLIVDGGLLSNFPLWIFPKGKKALRPVLGVKLTDKPSIENATTRITNAFSMFHALFSTMKKAHDARYISKTEAENILFVPTGEMQATYFEISEKEKHELVISGKSRANQFLKKWPK